MPSFSFLADQWILTVFLVFSRIGMCLMVMPGLSSARIPARFRLFLAIALSLAVVPLVGSSIHHITADAGFANITAGMAAEALIGLTIGLTMQAVFWAFQFISNLIAMAIGYSGQPGISVMESRPESGIGNLLTIGALMLFFASNMHLVLLRGLIASYQVLPVSLIAQPQAALIDLVDALSATFTTGLHLAAPFLLYAILINFATGLINKMTPTIPVYFISMPFVIGGGLLLLYLLIPEILNLFSEGMSRWIEGNMP